MSKRTGIMLCYPFEEKRLSTWPKPWLVQPKLDGDRCRAIFDSQGALTLLSSEEHIITSVPHIYEELQNLGLRDIELDGELYRHGASFQQINSVVSRSVNLHPDFDMVEFHVFDYVSDEAQYVRATKLTDNIKNSDSIRIVPTEVIDSIDQVTTSLTKFTEMGYEGIILRNIAFPYLRKRSTGMMKFKPRRSDYYTIVGFEEEISIHGEPKGSLGALWLEDQSGARFKVGSGSFLTRENRQRLWQTRNNLINKTAHVKYQHLSDAHIPRFAVLIDIMSQASFKI